MDSEDRSFSGSAQEVAGVHRSVCHLDKSPMLPIFFSVPRSERTGHGCSAPELGWVAGVCLSSLVSNSSCAEEAPVVLWSPPDHNRSLLASETLVSGASGSGGGRSGSSSVVSRSFKTTALPSSSSWGVRAVSSCVETIQRFARSQGFSSHVAKQVHILALVTKRNGRFIDSGVFLKDIRSLALLFPRWPTFYFGCVGPGNCPFLLCWVNAQCSLRYFIFSFLRSFCLLFFKISYARLRWRLLVVRFVLHHGTWRLFYVIYALMSSNLCLLVPCATLLGRRSFLVSLATAKRVGEIQALSRMVSFSSSAAGISYVPEFLAKTESAVRPLPRSFSIQSLQDFAVGLPEELLLCSVRSLREYLRRTSSFVNCPRRLFVSPWCPSRAMS